MKRINVQRMVLSILLLFCAGGCSRINVVNWKPLVESDLFKPSHIWVHEFASHSAAVPLDSDLSGHHHDGPDGKTGKDITEGRQLASLITQQIISDLNAMGMPAAQATDATKPEENDLVLRGYLVSFDEGDAKKRVLIGIGQGEAELHVAVEGFQMTHWGLRKLGSGETDTHDNHAPGTAVAAITMLATKNPLGMIVSTGMKVHGEKSGKSTVEGRAKATGQKISKQLEERFRQQGWIESSPGY